MGKPNSLAEVTPAHARQLIAAALKRDADRLAERHASGLIEEGSVPDIALLFALAESVSGWTHTTRLREWLEAGKTFDLREDYLTSLNVEDYDADEASDDLDELEEVGA